MPGSNECERTNKNSCPDKPAVRAHKIPERENSPSYPRQLHLRLGKQRLESREHHRQYDDHRHADHARKQAGVKQQADATFSNPAPARHTENETSKSTPEGTPQTPA